MARLARALPDGLARLRGKPEWADDAGTRTSRIAEFAELKAADAIMISTMIARRLLITLVQLCVSSQR